MSGGRHYACLVRGPRLLARSSASLDNQRTEAQHISSHQDVN